MPIDKFLSHRCWRSIFGDSCNRWLRCRNLLGTAFIREFFIISYIVLAPFVGPFADALPKGKVMFLSNGIKFFGCVLALLGVPPLYAYAIVGIGAAAYSPAKYGILTEMLPPNQLIMANGWMEGTYRFVRDDGSSFLAVIPRFTLAAEPRADTVS